MHHSQSHAGWGSAAVNDPQRLAALRETDLLDSPREESFDRLTRLAARMLGTPVALLCLADDQRQFLKSAWGLPDTWASRSETPLTHSFCRHVIATGEPLVITDARRDAPADEYAAPDLDVAAYIGVPLSTPDGHVLGSFCVMDWKPRTWSDEEIELLRDVTASVAGLIALHTIAVERVRGPIEGANQSAQAHPNGRDTEQRFQFVLAAMKAGFWQLDFASGKWTWSPEMCELHGCERTSAERNFYSRHTRASR